MTYKRCLVTFFDILGFRNIVATREDEFIEQVLLKLREHASPDEFQQEHFEIETIAFSDSIVRSVHIESESNVSFPTGIFWHELFALAWLQSYLIFDDGVFLRGSITADRLHLNDGVVFGPGLVRAYDIESKEANYPRIIVDEQLMATFQAEHNLLGAAHHDLATDQEFIDSYAIIDTDGKRFIDYLNMGHITADGDFSEMLNVLDRHYERVIFAANTNAGNESVLEKYRWVGAYHNSVVNRYADEEYLVWNTTKNDYLLTNDNIPGVEGWTIQTGKVSRPEVYLL